MHGVYFYFTLEVLLRFMMVVGMAFAALAAYFILIAEWFAKTPLRQNRPAQLVPLLSGGRLVYSVAGALYALRP